jgi:hypothetical protein
MTDLPAICPLCAKELERQPLLQVEISRAALAAAASYLNKVLAKLHAQHAASATSAHPVAGIEPLRARPHHDPYLSERIVNGTVYGLILGVAGAVVVGQDIARVLPVLRVATWAAWRRAMHARGTSR